MTSTEALVRHYLAVTADLDAGVDDLRACLAPDAVLVEHPNLLNPRGHESDVDGAVAGFVAGGRLLGEQDLAVHDVVVDGDRVAVRATWNGTVAEAAGPFAAGQRLRAEVAAVLEVRDGLVTRHETFDCFHPFEPAD